MIYFFKECNMVSYSFCKSSWKICFSFTRQFLCVYSPMGAELPLKKFYKPIKIIIYHDIVTFTWEMQTISTNVIQCCVCIIYIIAVWCLAAYITNWNIKSLISCSGILSVIINADNNIFLTPYCLYMCSIFCNILLIWLISPWQFRRLFTHTCIIATSNSDSSSVGFT